MNLQVIKLFLLIHFHFFIQKKDVQTRREKMNNEKFQKMKPLNRLQWSNWMVAMHYRGSRKGIHYLKWLNGYITKKIFTRDLDKPAVYEIGIRTRRHGKIYVAGFKILDRLPLTGRWYGPLVGRKDIREKIKCTMNMHGSVHIRRGVFRRRNKKFIEKVRKHLANSNYAFGISKKNARTFNIPVRGGFVLY